MQIRHIVIAIDGSPTSLAGMEAAAGLASLLRAAVTGLLIEDTNLLRMASLPFSRVIGSHSGAFRIVSTDDVERQFHSQADRARNTLWYAAERYRLTAAFSVARGSVAEELKKAVCDADLLCIGKGGESVSGHDGLGRNATALLEHALGSVMLFSHVANVSGPQAVFYDGSSTADRALEASIELSKVLGAPITVLGCPDGPQENLEGIARKKAVDFFPDIDSRLQFRWVHSQDGRDLARLARSTGANMIVVPNGDGALRLPTIEKLTSCFFGPVLVVGGDSDRPRSLEGEATVGVSSK